MLLLLYFGLAFGLAAYFSGRSVWVTVGSADPGLGVLATLLFGIVGGLLGMLISLGPLLVLERVASRHRRQMRRNRWLELANDLHHQFWSIKVHQDRFGQLWRTPRERPLRDLYEVRVHDPADDSIRWLRVPDDMQTAHQAVAWTYGRLPQGYNPAKRT